ncbi:30S ribosome-binding factor RbfA [bacterium]|nr:30S ribosome-binding factor RbfA [bacterium]
MAPSVRQQRVAQAISRGISVLLLQELGDSALAFVTLQRVKLSSDLSVATIYYTIYGDQSREKVAEAFDKHGRFIRGQIGKQLRHLRIVPELRFIYDNASDEMQRLEKIFDDAKRESAAKQESEKSSDDE